MDGNTPETVQFSFRKQYPWSNLFRAFRIALSLEKIGLAAIAVLLLILGEWGISYLPFAPEIDRQAAPAFDWPWQQDLGLYAPEKMATFSPRELTSSRSPWWNRIEDAPRLMLSPLYPIYDPAWQLLSGQANRFGLIAYHVTRMLWALAIWGLFAGIITRIAAVQFARDEKITVKGAGKFAASKWLSYLTAPLLPLLGVLVFGLFCWVFGLIGRIPGVGEWFVGVLWILPLLFSFVIALVLVGILFGWPLMIPTISTEGTDAFDGFSRSYSFVFNRTWLLLWLCLLALIHGTLAFLFVSGIASGIMVIAAHAVGWGMGVEPLTLLLPVDLPEGAAGLGMVAVWDRLVRIFLFGLIASYFWTALTVMYFILRLRDDATSLEEVYIPANATNDHLIPQVGVAQSEQPVIERPPGKVAPDPAPEEKTEQQET